MPTAMQPLPGDVVEVLGRAPLGNRQQLHMVRFANKLVLVSTTPGGEMVSLAEIEDRDEVNRIVALCRRGDANSSSETFRRLLHQFGQEPAEPGFVGDSGAYSSSFPHGRRARDERGAS
ncbi:MAG: flagellar biosynthetic protein FliO [Pirellulales bacterium]